MMLMKIPNYLMQIFMALDRLANAALFAGYAGETMSARIWRMYQRNKLSGKILMTPVNLLFRWQGYKDHCERAFYKCLSGEYLPPEYQKISREEARKFLGEEP
jgi:hypothetical protein